MGASQRRAVARIEKLVAARARAERVLGRRIEQAMIRARRRGVSWPRIVRALAGTHPRHARRTRA